MKYNSNWIIKLREEGKTIREIMTAVGCTSPAVIQHHLAKHKNLSKVKKGLYNILADFAIVVDKCHKNGVEPSCEKEIEKIVSLFSK